MNMGFARICGTFLSGHIAEHSASFYHHQNPELPHSRQPVFCSSIFAAGAGVLHETGVDERISDSSAALLLILFLLFLAAAAAT
jgi:hypothetical protein